MPVVTDLLLQENTLICQSVKEFLLTELYNNAVPAADCPRQAALTVFYFGIH
jgi:hypothetical protein